jgi:hypothetical protein
VYRGAALRTQRGNTSAAAATLASLLTMQKPAAAPPARGLVVPTPARRFASHVLPRGVGEEEDAVCAHIVEALRREHDLVRPKPRAAGGALPAAAGAALLRGSAAAKDAGGSAMPQ